MAYVTPVTDRTAADVTAKNSKAYFNVADWTRVYGNSQWVNAMVIEKLKISLTFNTLTTPTVTTIPTVNDFDTMLANIERMRVALLIYFPSLLEVKDDWEAGFNKDAPDYLDANLWEQTIDYIYQNILGVAARRARTGIARSGVGLTRNNRFRR